MTLAIIQRRFANVVSVFIPVGSRDWQNRRSYNSRSGFGTGQGCRAVPDFAKLPVGCGDPHTPEPHIRVRCINTPNFQPLDHQSLNGNQQSSQSSRMALTTYLSTPVVAGIFLLLTATYTLITAFSSPLRHIPGPWYTHFTHLILKYHVVTGNRIHYIHALHAQYGPIVRISPHEVAISDPESVSAIHKIGSGFLKSAWYDGNTSMGEPGIFSMRDPQQHSARRKLFARAFSVSSLLANWEPEIREKTGLAVEKIKSDAMGAGADVFKWWTLMTTDVIAHLSFGESFHMLEQGKVSKSCECTQSLTDYGSKHLTSIPSNSR